jgi:5-methylthioadenosine/S-adenosylhomocysteine deaminase
MKRRVFLSALAAGAAGALTPAIHAQERRAVRPVPRVRRGTQILVKGGTVLSLDRRVGDFDVADVLIDGATIAAVGPNLAARADAYVVDASRAIVMPGFIDTHRHMWEGSLRNILPNGLLSDYTRDITGAARAIFRPEDAHAGDLVSGLGAINAGVTTVLDWSHIGNSPEHTDAAIAGLRESGVRSVYAYGGGTPGPRNQFPRDIARLRRQYFSSTDQLLTLAMAAATNAADWAVARDVGAPITLHVNGAGSLLPLAASMKADCTYIHCDNLTEDEWRLIASTGGHVSISGPIEMEMGHGVPPFQQALAHGIRPSLSVDVETQMPGDLFTQMRTAFTLQRMQVLARERAGEKNLPPLLAVRDVVEFATIEGAKANALDAKVGTLTPGKQADIIVLRHDRLNVLPLNNAYGAVVLDMDTSNVDTVFIAGAIVKSGGQLVGVDVERVSRLAQQSRDYILSKTGWPASRVR